MSVKGVRPSKFRYLEGKPLQLRDCYGDVTIGTISTESAVIKANETFWAVPWKTPASVCVVPHTRVGTVPEETPLIINNNDGDKVGINEFNFAPHNADIVALAGQDGTAAIYRIPSENGLSSNVNDAEVRIQASDKRLLSVDWHPLASGTLYTTAADKTVSFFDVEAGGAQFATLPNVHGGLLTNTSWNYDGSLLVTAAKDKLVRIFDPRGSQLVAQAPAHPSPKSSRVQWMGKADRIIVAGFNKTNGRELAVYDPRNFSDRIATAILPASSSTCLLFEDVDNSLLFVAGKGDGNITYFEVANDAPFAHELSQYKSNTPQNGLALLPKSAVNVRNCEIVRFLKLSGTKVEPIRVEVPRSESNFFQEDIYPPTWDGKATMTSSQWQSGANNARNLTSLESRF